MKDINFEIKIPKFEFSDQKKFRLKLGLSLAIIVAAFVAKQNFDFTFFGTLILIYFGISIIWKLSSRIAAGLALFFLASCPVLLIFKNEALAETFAVYAYYFLVITVIDEIISLRKDDNLDSNVKIEWPRTNFALVSQLELRSCEKLVRGVHNLHWQPCLTFKNLL